MITETDVNTAYDKLEETFNALAIEEDRLEESDSEVQSFKDGSSGKAKAIVAYRDQKTRTNTALRAFRLAGMRVDRILALLDVQRQQRH